MLISDIKPLQSDKYKLVVTDLQKGFYMLVDKETGQQSPIYGFNDGRHLIIYGCFKDCHGDDYKYFDSLCEMEMTKC